MKKLLANSLILAIVVIGLQGTLNSVFAGCTLSVGLGCGGDCPDNNESCVLINPSDPGQGCHCVLAGGGGGGVTDPAKDDDNCAAGFHVGPGEACLPDE